MLKKLGIFIIRQMGKLVNPSGLGPEDSEFKSRFAEYIKLKKPEVTVKWSFVKPI
jgi:hypothetical protein